MHWRGLIVAIDGPAGAGKTTVARRLAERFSLFYLDTGATFRAVALKALRQGADLDNEEVMTSLTRDSQIEFGGELSGKIFLDGEDVSREIRLPEVARASSRVAVHAGVRMELVGLWRQLAGSGGVVLVGRDIGTVVFPNAPLKFFIDASPEVRAERRFRDIAKDASGSLETTAKEITLRDSADRERRYAPLRCASDAIVIDTSQLSPDETLERLASKTLERLETS